METCRKLKADCAIFSLLMKFCHNRQRFSLLSYSRLFTNSSFRIFTNNLLFWLKKICFCCVCCFLFSVCDFCICIFPSWLFQHVFNYRFLVYGSICFINWRGCHVIILSKILTVCDLMLHVRTSVYLRQLLKISKTVNFLFLVTVWLQN